MNKKRVALLALVVVIIVAAIAGWRWYAARHTPLTLYGNVDIRTVNLSFRVSGRLASLAVDEGDAVRAGQPLGDLDPTPQQNALRGRRRTSPPRAPNMILPSPVFAMKR